MNGSERWKRRVRRVDCTSVQRDVKMNDDRMQVCNLGFVKIIAVANAAKPEKKKSYIYLWRQIYFEKKMFIFWRFTFRIHYNAALRMIKIPYLVILVIIMCNYAEIFMVLLWWQGGHVTISLGIGWCAVFFSTFININIYLKIIE